MPYIDEDRREVIDCFSIGDAWAEVRTAGELNYAVTSMITNVMDAWALDAREERPTYAMFNAVVGALESCKLEFYRRAVAPYENTKVKENGDIPLYEESSRTYYQSVAKQGAGR